ncbi:TetR/AcrR family transcriptional regulator [Limibacter armeniacum]|uniref:TetR/AcrR family transcriptional regulator n=1 Tax=Limibacter armeniacum TaxID=466084 RepID=UPI002FE686C1
MNIQLMKVVDKKAAVLNAALELIVENGFHGTPMSKVAKQANVAAGTIYHYFESKEEMIDTLYTTLKEEMGNALLRDDDTSLDYKERFYAFWQNLFLYFTQNPKEFVFLEQYANSPLISKSIKEDNVKHYLPVIQFLEEGIKLGILREMDSKLMTSLLYGNIISTAKLQLVEDYQISPELMNQAINSCWDSVKAN